MFLSELARLLFGSGKPKAATGGRSSYRAVEVLPGHDGCCMEAEKILGKRYLSDEVPMLPVPGCDAESCGCTYKLYADRRQTAEECEAPASDRRQGSGRRDADRAA